MKFIYRTLAILFYLFANYLSAYEKYEHGIIKITQSKRKEVYSPEKQLSKFKLPEGFIIELVASEVDGIINPIDLTFDDAGRLWTQTAEMYPLDPKSKSKKDPGYQKIMNLYKLTERGSDKILVIENPLESSPLKSKPAKISTAVTGLTIPQSILPYKNGVYVAHGSEMLYIEDKDSDGNYETAKSVLTGFGFADTHTMAHSLVRAPGGWIQFSQGAMNVSAVEATASGQKLDIKYSKIGRFSVDGKKIELVSSGLNNIWGFQLRENGQWYGAEANDKGMSIVPMEPGTGFYGIGNDRLRPYQPMVPALHGFRVGGSGISGLAFSEDGSNGFPKEWKNVALLANTITNTINAVQIDRDASGKVIAKHLPDLLKCEDDWFRPVNIEFGPDGCLYIADWYNKIVSHNEVRRNHPDRDKSHGRIWRIRHVNQVPGSVPNLVKTETSDLVKHLTADNRWEKRAAWHQIADRQAKELGPKIKNLLLDESNSTASKVHALWSLESLKIFDEELYIHLLKHSDANIRREAVRSLASFDLSADQLVLLLDSLVEDSDATVRSQVLRTLEEVSKPSPKIVSLLVKASKPDLGNNKMGGGYERSFERYLARKALETYSADLTLFLNSPSADNYPITHLLWALQALPKQEASKQFTKIWKKSDESQLDKETFISIASLLDDQEVYNVVQPMFTKKTNAHKIVSLAIEAQDRFTSPKLKLLLKPAVVHLISTGDRVDQALAIDAANKFKLAYINNEVVELMKNNFAAALLPTVLPILELEPQKNKSLIKGWAEELNLSANNRLIIIQSLLNIDYNTASELLNAFITNQPELPISVVVEQLSKSRAGAKALIQLVSDKKINPNIFNFFAAQRVHQSNIKDKVVKSIQASANKRENERVQSLDAKIKQYAKAVETLVGNPLVGQGLFQSCLACHEVNGQGLNIAPALDGSANRELEALLTSIVNPNAAIEGGYRLYRVIKKDGSIIEGYLDSKTDHGISIAVMGGNKFFIPKSELTYDDFVTGQSFMPSMFSDLPEQTMVDLITYIKTLK